MATNNGENPPELRISETADEPAATHNSSSAETGPKEADLVRRVWHAVAKAIIVIIVAGCVELVGDLTNTEGKQHLRQVDQSVLRSLRNLQPIQVASDFNGRIDTNEYGWCVLNWDAPFNVTVARERVEGAYTKSAEQIRSQATTDPALPAIKERLRFGWNALDALKQDIDEARHGADPDQFQQQTNDDVQTAPDSSDVDDRLERSARAWNDIKQRSPALAELANRLDRDGLGAADRPAGVLSKGLLSKGPLSGSPVGDTGAISHSVLDAGGSSSANEISQGEADSLFDEALTQVLVQLAPDEQSEPGLGGRLTDSLVGSIDPREQFFIDHLKTDPDFQRIANSYQSRMRSLNAGYEAQNKRLAICEFPTFLRGSDTGIAGLATPDHAPNALFRTIIKLPGLWDAYRYTLHVLASQGSLQCVLGIAAILIGALFLFSLGGNTFFGVIIKLFFAPLAGSVIAYPIWLLAFAATKLFGTLLATPALDMTAGCMSLPLVHWGFLRLLEHHWAEKALEKFGPKAVELIEKEERKIAGG